LRNFGPVFSLALLVTGWAARALALTAEVPTRDPSLVGQAFTFRAVTSGAVGVTQYRWNFGDGPAGDFVADASEVQHTYAQPGHYSIIVTIKDQAGFTSVAFGHTVHYPVKARRPSASTDIVYDQARHRIYTTNEDDDSITVIDAAGLKKVAEIPVYQRPEALALTPEGKLWVVHRDDYAVAVVDLDGLAVERGFRLPYASQPMGLAMSPTGDAAYITLMAVGKLLKLNPSTGDAIGAVAVGPWPRGVSVSEDGRDVYVTRFISADAHGEVVQVDGPMLKVVKRIELAPDTTTADSDQGARGLPNYLFSIGISPDARQAWVAGKSDNVFRGGFRDGLELNQDDTVRPAVSILDLAQGVEQRELRIDMDDRNLATHLEFSPLGDFVFVTATGSGLIEVHDAYTKGFVTALKECGIAPRGVVLGPQNRLFVHGALTHNVVVFDVTDILTSTDQRTIKLADIPAVASPKLSADALRGKQIFYNSADGRMTVEGYISCASCHFEGFEDGRVWDFTSRGEGLRNTVSLLGRKGTAQGRIHWSGNFDEIQDFEQEIRGLFNGSGFLPDAVLSQGTRNDPLGDHKAGLSKELDALAAYVETLDHVHPSPYRNADGSMTAAAEAGKTLFFKLGCDFCHVGLDMTDSARGMLHDVGTIKASSGKRSGGALLGIDTPTLLGIWETAPYLHDGSAATLRDVLTTANPKDEHGFVSSLTSEQVDQLVAYLQQLDSELAPRRLPFEPPLPVDGGGDAPRLQSDAQGRCTCTLLRAHEEPAVGTLWTLVPLFVWYERRRTRKVRREGGA